MIKTSKKWYAVYTRPRWEKKVSELLTRKKIENYCPLNKVERYWSDRKKIIFEPLFTSYVFVYVSESEHLEIRKTDGVINFVYYLAKAAVIRTEEIEVIKQFLSEYDNVKLAKAAVNPNDHIRITDGALMNLEGSVLEMRQKTIIVMLPSLGHNLVAEVKKTHVKLISSPSKSYAAK